MNFRIASVLPVALVLVSALDATARAQAPKASIEVQANREVAVGLTATAGEYYRWEASEDSVQWEPVVTWLSTGSDSHLDSAAPYHPSRFYRATELSETPPLTGDHLMTATGTVVIHPINHATLVLEWNGTVIYADPVGGAAPFQGLPRADLVLITHAHGDHFNSGTIDAVRDATVDLVVPSAVYSSLTSAQQQLATVLANGQSAVLQGVQIEAVPAYNLTASYHPKGVGNGYVLTLGGKRLYVAGDTEDTPELRALESIDVAFLPMNLPYTMNVAKAASATREFRPRVIYPYHYRNQNGTFADLTAFKEQVGFDLGIEVRLRDWY